MKVEKLIEEYLICKSRINALNKELEILEEIFEVTGTCPCGDEATKYHLLKTNVFSEVLNKREALEIQIKMDRAFVAKIDDALESLKQDLGESEYKIFELKHFQQMTLEYLAGKSGYASSSSIQRKLKKQEKRFKKMLAIGEKKLVYLDEQLDKKETINQQRQSC